MTDPDTTTAARGDFAADLALTTAKDPERARVWDPFVGFFHCTSSGWRSRVSSTGKTWCVP